MTDQAVITISAAVDVDLNNHQSVESQARDAVLNADVEVESLDGLEFEEVVEVREVEEFDDDY